MFDKRKLQEIQAKKKEVDEEIVNNLQKRPERKKQFKLDSEIPVERYYTPLEIEETDYLRDLGFPGKYPYTRGVQTTMYRGKLWTMRQYAGFGSAEETNRRFHYLLEQGQTGLSIAFDLPTQIGYDSDHPMAKGEVGRVGVAIDSLKDLEVLMEGIPLDKVSTSMTINSPAAILLAMYLVIAEKQGIKWETLNGTIQNDILKEYVARGTFIFPPRESMRLIVDVFAFARENLPRWNTISISGYHIREAGSTAVQEIAFTLANGIAYVQAALEAGLDVDEFAPRLSFFFNAHVNFLEEIAKFRAARRIWARIMKERFGAKNERSMMLRFHTQTAGCSLTAQQPEVNVIRVAFQALSAVLGGTQSLHTNSRDEALALPSEESVRIALRTQQVIGHEIGVADTVDPLGGSYYIESLTNQMEESIMDYLEKIDQMGGAIESVEKGYMQKEIQQSAYRYQKDIENDEKAVVGVNRFVTEEDVDMELLRVTPAVAEQQKKRLAEVRESRDEQRVEESLSQLREVASSQDNLLPSIIEAVRSYATLGEICGILREELGEYQQQALI